ncbi:5526_t:CDS:2, partial [Dentiscutata erythropus]
IANVDLHISEAMSIGVSLRFVLYPCWQDRYKIGPEEIQRFINHMSSQANVIGLFVINIGFKSEALNQATDSKIFLCTNDNLIEIVERCYEDTKKESFLNFGHVIIKDLEFNDGPADLVHINER